jgi:hypothetical protein
MQQAVQRIFSLFIKTNPPRKRNVRKSRGQSLVEVAITFPILIILFSGVVEFGFIINNYLSLLDATREAARKWSGDDPFCDEVSASCPLGPGSDDQGFYFETAKDVQRILDPKMDKTGYRGRRILLDPAHDDVIVSVYGADGNTITLCRDLGVYHYLPTAGNASGNYPSMFKASDILNTRVAGAPDEGLLLVEIHYTYHQVLKLPWLKPFDPIILRAYTIMPIRAAEPPKCPP